MTYTANHPQPGSVHRDGVAIAFTRGAHGEAEAEARRIAAALTAVETGTLSSSDYELIADALDVLDPDGSEATNRKQELEAWARAMAATGRGYLPPAGADSLPAIRALIRYAADAPDIVCGEGYWDDGSESANADGMNQARSEAAALIRDALGALGIEPPKGLKVCPECYRDESDGHSYQCSHDGEEADDDEEAEGLTESTGDPLRQLAAEVLAIGRDDDGDAMLDAEGLDELQAKARALTA